uniref:Uncharacterized protein n=1 Tax=Macrostomum lignano TaxID=282301 RepID=A0A1I8FMY7_9PLAT
MEQLHAASDGPGVAGRVRQAAAANAACSVSSSELRLGGDRTNGVIELVRRCSCRRFIFAGRRRRCSSSPAPPQRAPPASRAALLTGATSLVPPRQPQRQRPNPTTAQQPAPWPSTSAAAVAPAAAASAALSNAAWRQFDQADPFDVTWADRAARATSPAAPTRSCRSSSLREAAGRRSVLTCDNARLSQWRWTAGLSGSLHYLEYFAYFWTILLIV